MSLKGLARRLALSRKARTTIPSRREGEGGARSSYLARVLLALGIAGAQHVVGDPARAVVGLAAVLVAHDGHGDLVQDLVGAAARRAHPPARHDAVNAREGLAHGRQADRSHRVVEAHLLVQPQQRDVVVERHVRVAGVLEHARDPAVHVASLRRRAAVVLEQPRGDLGALEAEHAALR